MADSAVKIGLGALLGGAFGVWVAWLNNKSQVRNGYLERRREILEAVVESVDLAANSASLYWANLANAVYIRDKGEDIPESDLEELKKLENKFFLAFTKLNSSSAKLLMLGETSAEEKLAALRECFNGFFQIANLKNDKCTKQSLIEHKDSMTDTRREFFSQISNAYCHDA